MYMAGTLWKRRRVWLHTRESRAPLYTESNNASTRRWVSNSASSGTWQSLRQTDNGQSLSIQLDSGTVWRHRCIQAPYYSSIPLSYSAVIQVCE
ncbi:hypothetical protein GDO78_003414 [Eleutherodactylus coqui]|uniref:Uncharacterized protein n=1 Tax=Eleutherodactylus coqui TaxID=57060 RepID=A0A8J6ES91_ELECQ|nr:hypothetical protein GDO78_003414 [Eleutherodactylus coqui]